MRRFLISGVKKTKRHIKGSGNVEVEWGDGDEAAAFWLGMCDAF